jgi:hypothetical protein
MPGVKWHSRRGVDVVRIAVLHCVLAILLPLSGPVFADASQVITLATGAGTAAIVPTAWLPDRQDSHPAITLLTAGSPASGQGVLGLDWRDSVAGCRTSAAFGLNCLDASRCFVGRSGNAFDRLAPDGGLPCGQREVGAVPARANRLPALLRVALYTDGAMGWRRLDNSCHGNSADRCSMVSVVFGIRGAGASLQWREDGARALIARREFAGDALHVRFQLTYQFE